MPTHEELAAAMVERHTRFGKQYRIVDELLNELGPTDEPGFWHLDAGNLQWLIHEGHKRLKAAEENNEI